MNVSTPAAARHRRWIASSHSAQGNCVEVAPGLPGFVPVRDSKTPNGAALRPCSATWSAFLAALRNGALE